MPPSDTGENEPSGMQMSLVKSSHVRAVPQLSLLVSRHPPIVFGSFTVVCLLPHSNKGGRRSCGSSRSGSSAGTMRSRCAGRRSGGARSTSRSAGTGEPRRWPRCELLHQLSLGCGSPSLRTAQCKQVFILSQAAILTYSRSQMHNPGNVHSLKLASYPG